uniref:Neurotransmitter-gated ion-channel ligand-binding domain-containing protein n=1 Tax=Setaria digitata TaxID=48799 RepID=A0A915Q0D9_9BILA
MSSYFQGNDTVAKSDKRQFSSNQISSGNNNLDDVTREENEKLSLNENDPSKDDEHDTEEFSWNNSIQEEIAPGDINFIRDTTDKANITSGNYTFSDDTNSVKNKNYTSEFPEFHDNPKLSVLWINTTYQAYDIGLNITSLNECTLWNASVLINNITDTSMDDMNNATNTEILAAPGVEIVNTKERLRELGLNTDLLEQYQEIAIIFEEICKNYSRELWFSTVEDARRLGITKIDSFICDPFKDELHPSREKLKDFEHFLNKIVQNSTSDGLTMKSENETVTSKSAEEGLQKRTLARYHREVSDSDAGSDEFSEVYDTDNDDSSVHSDKNSWTSLQNESEEDDDKEEIQTDNDDNEKKSIVIAIDITNQQARMILRSWKAAEALRLNLTKHIFERHQLVGLLLDGICADFVPSAVDEFNATEFAGIDIEGPIGLNITALSLSGVNLTELAEKLRNDTEVDMILSRTMTENGTLGGSFILPVLQKNQYDPFSAPIVFQGSAVVVRFGIYIESMSNFQTSTMDYDMDIFLMMGWRDARLVNPYEKAILVKEEEILEKIWRPDPFFANAKEASFHEVTFLNFLMRIYNDGLVLYETRIKLRPSCNLVLCKYPHDKQTCDLKIKSFAYPIETVRFEWFSNKRDAIDKNPDVTLPELYIYRYEPTYCERARKSGHFSCLRAIFRLKRDVGFHIAQTYIPTSLALMFSWVGVWLPEEFMEGRIGVAITVLLTLSTESAGAREHLPSVSYMKRKSAAKKKSELTEQSRELMLARAERYHKRGRYLDNFCRLFYPLAFLIFLIAYYFVFTEGRQNDCVVTGRQT